jgi:energy-converting hydrogenase Eha subunit G
MADAVVPSEVEELRTQLACASANVARGEEIYELVEGTRFATVPISAIALVVMMLANWFGNALLVGFTGGVMATAGLFSWLLHRRCNY